MTPVIHCSVSNIHLFPRTTFIQRKGIQLTKYNVPGKFSRPTTHSQRFLLPQSSLQLFQIYRNGCVYKYGSTVQTVAAVGTDLTVEETTPAVSGEDTDETSGNPSDSVKTNESPPANPAVASTAKSKRQRPGRKSDMPPIKNEELVPGATFTGKVRSIQPFGAFVDFGAFTDGLVHVSRMSDGYVKDVNALVSIGQEVKVRIVEANIESGRISLSMRENDDTSKMQQRKETSASGSSDRPRPVRKNAGRSNQRREEGQKTSKFVKGQVLDGTVKNLTRSGAFVSLPDGEEGFIPVSEESEGFGNVLGNSSLQVGQEVNVRVLRITRGQVTLTMKKEEDIEGMNKRLNQGVVYIATNPFELAFRKNKDIASFLDEQEKAQKSSQKVSKPKTSEEAENKVDETTSLAGTEAEGKETTSEAIPKEISLEEPTSSEPVRSNEEPVSESLQTVNAVLDDDSSSTLTEIPIPDDLKDSSMAIGMAEEQVSASETLVSEGCESSANLVADEASITNESKEPSVITESTEENKVLTSETLTFDPIAGEDSNTGDLTDNSSEGGISEEVASAEADDTVSTEAVELEKPLLIEDAVTSGDPTDAKLEVPEATNGQTENPNQGSAVKATISPALVKQLREETGAGMMDCKKALTETGGDLVKAQEFLRTKGLASADKKASRTTAEGRIGSYIHDSRIGVLIEVNCETDFVSRGEIFKQLVDDLAMQVAACPQVQYLVTEDVSEETVNKEREIEMQKEDLQSKPEQFRSKIVEGRIRKRLEELALLEQPYIKNDKVVVKDLVKQTIATIGENIKVRRFIRYNLGEGLEKKSQDFAAEVAAQTATKDSPAVPKDQPAETKETVEKPPTVTVSAALVKQLREETGAGMMDCKKALSETGGDLEKAQEYLRKKGLSSADKKSSRLAAEGRISSYIHDSRIGCLIEVNCETDFVGRNERFKELADDLAMQVVACPQVEYVSVEDIPESIIIKERELEMQREDLKSKPENIREKIVEGRISKRLGELALLEQPFIKDDSIILKDLVKQTVAGLGENIRVRRFVRFTLGESKD